MPGEQAAEAQSAVEHVDVLIVGAGLSGIGAACHLQQRCPGRSYAIVESREAIGGTWDLFRYPGIRSDSDMFTLGYRFKPWEQTQAIADGPAIRDYIREAARENGVERQIRFNSRVVGAEWSSAEQRWTVEIERTGAPGSAPHAVETSRLSCSFLFGCTGYYRYEEGYTPEFDGLDRFAGALVHPQHWPEDLDYEGKRVLVIGSGATAVTLVPAMAPQAEHVTMLQRSPSYVLSLPGRDPIAELLRRVLPRETAYAALRWKNVMIAMALYKLSRSAPELVKRLLRRGVERRLPPGYDLDKHFKPRYQPWDQRMCFVPDGDMFAAISSGRASIVTDRIRTFTEQGVLLESGTELQADVIVTATGLNLQALGGISIAVDGETVDLAETVGYKGMMLSGIPNMALALGYTNSSWTLKADLVSEYVCRLLNHMRDRGYRQFTPLAPHPSLPTEPFLDLKPGYVQRSIDQLPKQGARAPWRLRQNYPLDVRALRHGPLEDEGIEFLAAPATVAAEPERRLAA
ncbi:MAG: flavin-containing monooxygenase [Solirubrobacteraceae bacterium]